MERDGRCGSDDALAHAVAGADDPFIAVCVRFAGCVRSGVALGRCCGGGVVLGARWLALPSSRDQRGKRGGFGPS